MECTNLVDPHQLLCPWFTVVFVLFCIYTPRQPVPKTDCQLSRRSILFYLGVQSTMRDDTQKYVQFTCNIITCTMKSHYGITGARRQDPHMVPHVVVPPTNLFSFIFLFLIYFAWKIYGNTDKQVF